MMQSYVIKKIGQNRGIPRIWIEGNNPMIAGFKPGSTYSVQIDSDKSMITLKCDVDGTRTVSKKLAGELVRPIIDLNSIEILSVFDGLFTVRVIFRKGIIFILPLASEVRRIRRLARIQTKLDSNESLSIGSVSHGGGILSHALHSGIFSSGILGHLRFANDIREDLLTQAQTVNDAWNADTQFLAAPLQEIAFDDFALSKLDEVDILEGGLPCSGASSAGKAKRKINCAEAHPNVGHLVVGFLVIVAKVNPAIVVLENVPGYANSASMCILRNQLRDLGYAVHEAILEGADWNAMENRQRLSMVAVTEGIEFNFDNLAKPLRVKRKLSEILDPIADDDPRWSLMEGLKRKQTRDIAEGKNFLMQIFTEDSEKIGTLTKGMGKNRSTDPKIRHRSNPDLLRIPTPAEHARCKGVPDHLIQGLCATTAHELLGQSIVWAPFFEVGALIGRTLLQWHSSVDRKNTSSGQFQLKACG